jgi:hypothetical protein
MNGNGATPEVQGISIVARGSFNPAIFQPRWFSSHNLIRDEEAAVAEEKLEIIHRDLTFFSVEWLTLKVNGDGFVLETLDPGKSHALRDLAIGTFTILEHTPIDAFGLNTHRHYRMEDEETWHAFGNHFAPKQSWRNIIRDPGMISLTINGTRENCSADGLQVKVEPSTQVHPGVFIQVNEHYQLNKDKEASQRDRMMKFLRNLQESWDPFLSYCDVVSNHLFTESRREVDSVDNES